MSLKAVASNGRKKSSKKSAPIKTKRDPELGLEVLTNVDYVMQRLDDIGANLPQYTNDALVDFFGAAKPLEKKLKSINETARKQLIERREEFGADDRGHRSAVGNRYGVKLQRSVRVKVLPDAEQQLAEYLHLFDREIDPKKAEQALAAAGVERETYTVPVVTKERLEQLNEQGLIPDDVAVACLSDASEQWSALPIEPDKVT